MTAADHARANGFDFKALLRPDDPITAPAAPPVVTIGDSLNQGSDLEAEIARELQETVTS